MKWETLTGPDFANAVKACEGVCIFPIGVIEKHGDHLPLGQDVICAYEIAVQAAELEKAIVFPFYYFGMNTHAKCEPGAIALKFDLLLPVLESMCDEIARNGLKKIIFFNWHGGNYFMLNYLLQRLLDAPKDYMLYFLDGCPSENPPDTSFFSAKVDGHGGEVETSTMLALHPEYVKSDVPASYGMPLGREPYRKMGIATSSWWYADYPRMLMADQTPGTAEKGRKSNALTAERLAAAVKQIKADDTPLQLYREFLARCQNPVEDTLSHKYF